MKKAELKKNLKTDSNGNLYLSHLIISNTSDLEDGDLPENLRVTGTFKIECPKKLTKLPKGLTVEGPIQIDGRCKIKELPENLTCKEINAGFLGKLRSLPKGLTIGRLDLENTKITSLPNNLTAEYLYLDDSRITKIPNGTKVTVELFARKNSRVRSLPQNLKIAHLHISENQRIKSLPKGLVVGTLTAHNTCIKRIPKDTIFIEDAIFDGGQIESIPKNFTVGGDLVLIDCPISKLPENLTVARNLLLEGTSITILPKSLKVGNAVVAPPSLMKVMTPAIPGLRLIGPKNVELPDNFHVQDLNIKGGSIKGLPKGLKADEVYIANCDFNEIGENIEIDLFDIHFNKEKEFQPIHVLPGLRACRLYLENVHILNLPSDTYIYEIVLYGESIVGSAGNLRSNPNNPYSNEYGRKRDRTEQIWKELWGGSPFLEWTATDGTKYVSADLASNLTIEVEEERGKVIRGKRFYRGYNQYGRIGSLGKVAEEIFIVTDGNGTYAHGNSIRDAKIDLLYKLSDGRDVSQYKSLTDSSKLSYNEAIIAYKVITGACSLGISDFLARENPKKKEYTIAEIIDLTKGEFGHNRFVNFFKKNKS